MSQATRVEQKESSADYQGLRLPVDGLYEFIGDRIGGSKAREVVRFLRFGTVGTLGAVIDIGLSNILFATVLPTVTESGETIVINTITAATISFLAAITSNFFWNRYWTYPDSRSRPLLQQLILFAFICTVGWIGRTIWLSFATEPLTVFVQNNTSFTNQIAGQIGSSIAIFFGIFVVMIWNFVVNRLWTYNDVE